MNEIQHEEGSGNDIYSSSADSAYINPLPLFDIVELEVLPNLNNVEIEPAAYLRDDNEAAIDDEEIEEAVADEDEEAVDGE